MHVGDGDSSAAAAAALAGKTIYTFFFSQFNTLFQLTCVLCRNDLKADELLVYFPPAAFSSAPSQRLSAGASRLMAETGVELVEVR